MFDPGAHDPHYLSKLQAKSSKEGGASKGAIPAVEEEMSTYSVYGK